MRRSLFSVTSLFVLLMLALPGWAQQAVIPVFDSPVVDTTSTLDAASKQQLEQQALDLQQRKGSQLQVLMVPSTGPEAIESYAVRAFEQFKLGRKGVDDGVLLVVAKDDHKVRIEVGYGLEGAIPDITAGRVIQEYIVPKFRQDDYAGGVIDGTAQLVKLIDGEALPEPQSGYTDSSGHRDGFGDLDRIIAAIFFVFVAAQLMWKKFSRLPKWGRALIVAGGSGVIAWLVTSILVVGVFGAIFGLIVGVWYGTADGRQARSSRWGSSGGGYSSSSNDSSSSSSGSDWSGGGGSSGGGGASGSW